MLLRLMDPLPWWSAQVSQAGNLPAFMHNLYMTVLYRSFSFHFGPIKLFIDEERGLKVQGGADFIDRLIFE